MLLSCYGIAAYRIFKGLTAPAKPRNKNFIEFVTLMKDYQNPKRNLIAERFIFNSRNRKPEEDISNYMAELPHLSQYCKYGDSLEEMLRDKLVCGVNHERTQQRLLNEGASLTLRKAIDIAVSLEPAIPQQL